MNHNELDQFIKELDFVESFLTKIAVTEDEMSSTDFTRIKYWPKYENIILILQDFDRRLLSFMEFTKVVDKTLHDLIQKTINTTNIQIALGQLYVALKIAPEKKRRFQSFLNPPKRNTLFPPSQSITTQQVLINLHRLIPLAKRVSDVYLINRHQDDEIFKPSNIDKQLVIKYIECTIANIENVTISSNQKEKLLTHLNQTKNDLAEDNIPWKKVIGALVVAAAILSGIADASQALENINKAIQHILGTSIEKISPPALSPPPQIPDQQPKPINLA